MPDAAAKAKRSLLLWCPVPLLMILTSLPGGINIQALFVPVAVLGFILWRAWRMSQASVSIHPTHLVVRNILRTYRIAWQDVAQIGVNLSAPPEDLLRSAIGLPSSEASAIDIPEHRRVLDESDGIIKMLVSIGISVRGRVLFIDAVSSDLLDALAIAWAAQREVRARVGATHTAAWDEVISAEELQEWFQQDSSKPTQD